MYLWSICEMKYIVMYFNVLQELVKPQSMISEDHQIFTSCEEKECW